MKYRGRKMKKALMLVLLISMVDCIEPSLGADRVALAFLSLRMRA